MTLALCNISKYYGEKCVLNEFSLELSTENPIALMGPSGCGKTTVGNIFLGLAQPDAGRVLDFTGRCNSAVFQEDRLLEHLNALQNVRLVCPPSFSAEMALETLTMAGLSSQDMIGRSVATLSGGQRRRVSIVRALLQPFDFLLLDEPMSGLDDDARALMMELIHSRIEGRLVLLITHDATDATALGAHIVHLQSAP
ncbi:MAG: ATP-binding cassette domain-containing protein [Oscillospiraceae bacterium]